MGWLRNGARPAMGRFLLAALAMQYTIIDVSSASTGPVVQLDRISDFGSEGWGFESSLGHYNINPLY